MEKQPLPPSKDYQQSLSGLRELHALSLEGKDETPEADALRDRLEAPWYHLTEVEQKRLRGLSEDLYSLTIIEDKALKEMNPQVQKQLTKAWEESDLGNWDKALEVLRRWREYLKPSQLSFMRGRIWHELGDSAIAALFFAHAARLEPQSDYAFFHLRELVKLAPTEAEARAKEILAADDKHEASLVLGAVEVLVQVARERSPRSHLPLEIWLEIVERVLLRLELQPHQSRELYVLALVWAGWCAMQLDRREVAERNITRALTLSPNNDPLLVTRGMLLYTYAPQRAIEDFQKAILLGTKYSQPYCFLAHHALTDRRIRDCLDYCEQALKRPLPEVATGLIWEMKAISQAVLNYPAEIVRQSFAKALSYLPGNERIEGNRQVFEENITSPEKQNLPWKEPSKAEVTAQTKEWLPVPSPLAI
jgi:tetratricopeptide (TPR) repeat protein